MVSRLVRGLAWGSVVLLAGCEQQRPPLGEPICIGWKATVGALLEERCVDCHSATASNGDVVLDDYVAALAPTRPRDGIGADAHRIRARFQPTGTLARGPADARAMDRRLRYRVCLASDIHAAGIMDPEQRGLSRHASSRTLGYDFENCQRCHGEDYDGRRRTRRRA